MFNFWPFTIWKKIREEEVRLEQAWLEIMKDRNDLDDLNAGRATTDQKLRLRLRGYDIGETQG